MYDTIGREFNVKITKITGFIPFCLVLNLSQWSHEALEQPPRGQFANSLSLEMTQVRKRAALHHISLSRLWGGEPTGGSGLERNLHTHPGYI